MNVAMAADAWGEPISREMGWVGCARAWWESMWREEKVEPVQGGYHISVFPEETAEWMAACEGKWIVDGTLGGGGHSEGFLRAGARVLGVDRDPQALAYASERLASFGEKFSTWEGNFADVAESEIFTSGARADGWLLDLGVSSWQLDEASRGFSFMREGPLDMRMGPSCKQTAADVVNGWAEADLVRLFYEFGEEPKSRKIARAIVEQREKRAFSTTTELAQYIEKKIGRFGKTHPATRVFQAIRMAVNEELESLTRALESIPRVVKPGGRVVIITFHSLEDRLVKRFFKHRSQQWLDEPGWPEPRLNPDYQFSLLSRKAILPSEREIAQNARSRSAKLRAVELLPMNLSSTL